MFCPPRLRAGPSLLRWLLYHEKLSDPQGASLWTWFPWAGMNLALSNALQSKHQP